MLNYNFQNENIQLLYNSIHYFILLWFIGLSHNMPIIVQDNFRIL